MANILDLDDYLDGANFPEENDDLFASKDSNQQKKDKSRKRFFAIQNQMKDTSPVSPENSMKNWTLPTASDALTSNAKKKLESYLKKSPQYKTLTIQIDLLFAEFKNYKAIGKKDLAEKTRIMIQELTATRSKFVKLYKTKDWKKEKEERINKIGNSELLKELKAKRKDLEKQYQLINPHSLVSKVKELREILNIADKFDYDDVLNIEDVLDIDDILDTDSTFSFQQEYDNLCGHISDLAHISIKEIQNMNLSNILKTLKEEVEEEDIYKIKRELDEVKFQASTEISKLKGNEDITTVMYEIFDFEIVDEKQPKEMLAAANVEYVKAIAYNSCRKLNMLRNIDDAIAYGLMGLSIAINAWYKIQKIKDSPVSFTGFANQYVVNSIKKGLYELGSVGIISENSMANMVFYRKKRFEQFLGLNPELKDLPTEIIESLIDGLEDKFQPIPGVSSESDILDRMTGGDEGGDSDMWANSHKSDINDETFAEVKNEYEHLLKSLKALFNMFETKVDITTGETVTTQFKIFDKYDYKLFRLLYGLEFKRESLDANKSVADNTYSQTEIGIILADYYKANGIFKKPFSQPAIADRKLRLDKKLKMIMEENPTIKAGFQRLMYYCEAHSATIKTLSNKREEAEISKERVELSEIYSDNQKEMNKLLSDGKRLSDIYNSTDENPLDDEISQAFRNY